jgi:integrase
MKNHYWSITNIWVSEFPKRTFPLVFIAGIPSFVINQWVFYLLENGITQSLLEERLRAILHLAEYFFVRYGSKTLDEHENNKLLHDFLNAKRYGTINEHGFDPLGLYWSPLSLKTIKRYLFAINKFDKWQSNFHGSNRINPSEKHFMNAWEIYSEFQSRKQWDPMLHLFPSKKHVKEVYKHHIRESHIRLSSKNKNIPKAFPLDAFVDLVEQSPNPRDKMLWLMLFGLGLRQSEALHIFLEDCYGITDLGETKVRLGDPEFGEFRWYSNDRKLNIGTRAEYLANCYKNLQFKDTIPKLYNISPRSQYGGRGGMYAGFKGMSFDTSNGFANSHMFGHDANWVDPRLGIYFNKCLKNYLEAYFYNKPKSWPYHPFLFINVDKGNFGFPLTIPAIRKAWLRALKRIGLDYLPLGPHSLRHLTGYYCASLLQLPVETTKSILRHVNASSTTTYYHLSNQVVRNTIINAVAKNQDINNIAQIMPEEIIKLNLPSHWYENPY